MGTPLPRFSYLVVFFCFVAVVSFGQQVSSRPLITKPLVESELTTLKGNTHPLAQARFDIGMAPPDLPMNRMLLVLKRSPEQEHSLRTLLDNQQDKASPHYHKWLTPDQFGTQFGPADNDVQIVTGWLQSHGFEVNRVSHGRTVIEFSGTEAQVEEALHTSIHKYAVNGEEHWANASDPQIPAALAPAVAGVASLNNFPRKPLSKLAGTYSPKTRSLISVNPQFTFSSGNCYQGTCYAVGPADLGKIYNMQPLWNSGTDGTGQTIAIVGESDINLQDVHDFRNLFGLPANDPQIIYDGPNPGPQSDESEADIDVEWSGAIAPNATIDFVVSESTETTAGVDLSAVYIIDHNLAPVMSESYGLCELALGTSGNQFYNTLWAQAAAQGITVILASGDTGSNGCTYGAAKYGLNVSGFASTPFNVAIGGTDFNDLLNPQQYWSLSNTTSTQESANSYIPETTWNLSCTNSILLGDFGWPNTPENNCNNAQLENAGLVDSVGGSGGVSNCTTNSQALGSCSGGYTKPSWQVAPGVPADGKRDIPDVSLFASNGVMNNFYIYCEADLPYPYSADCAIGQYGAAGGTSFGAPIFAGIMALINQETNTTEGQGNADYVLYKLASQQSASACNSATGSGASCVFNDITSGTIAMPCVAGTPNCNVQTAGHAYGILSGYSTGPGYDLATGLGSLNVANLAANWSSVAFRPTTTSLGLSPTSSLTHGQAVTVTGSVAASSGTGTPTGKVSLLTSTGLGVDGFTLANGAISASTNLLPGGTYTVTAHYAGDPTFGGSDSTPVSITVGKENSSTQPELVTFDWNGNLISSNASTAVYGSPYLFRVNVLNSSGALCSPNPLGQSGCPTGTVNLTDNRSALDGGAFKLNSLGYTEDQLIQFPGGSNAVKATYAGDNSFNSSSATTTYSITPAPTTSDGLGCCGTVSVGSSFYQFWAINSQSSGVPPTGTVTYYANGTLLAGNTGYSTYRSPGWPPYVALYTTFNSSGSAFPVPGTYSITANYSGDANYQPATAATTVYAQYPVPRMTLQSSSNTVNAGTDTTLTVTVLGDSTTIAPVGIISFFGGFAGQLSGNVSYATVTDPNTGNLDLQGTLTISPVVTDGYYGSYGGDANYPSCQSCANTSITVEGSDFALKIPYNSGTISPGETAAYSVSVGFESNTAPVSLACTGLPRETTCSLPGSVSSAGAYYFTVSTTAPQSALALNFVKHSSYLWLSSLSPFVAILLIGTPRSRTWRLMLALMVMGVILAGVGCGGSGNGTGGGSSPTDPGTPPGSYTISVTGTSGSGTSAITHTTTFSLIVQ